MTFLYARCSSIPPLYCELEHSDRARRSCRENRSFIQRGGARRSVKRAIGHPIGEKDGKFWKVKGAERLLDARDIES
mgnify:CR=1 FL=1